MLASVPLFVSHGAPTLAVEPGRAGAMLRQLGAELEAARALVVVSAHWETAVPTASLAAHPATLHDFRGFPRALYAIRYAAPGAPAAARRVLELLDGAGIAAAASPDRGLDHGAWVPLLHLAPGAQTPVTQLSVVRGGSPQLHYRIGLALRALREEGIALVASGSLTHNLDEVAWHADGRAAEPWVVEFAAWFAARSAAGDVEALLDYRRRAPHAARNHPTEEHLLPYFVALGANAGRPLLRRPGGTTYGVLAMDAFAAAALDTAGPRPTLPA